MENTHRTQSERQCGALQIRIWVSYAWESNQISCQPVRFFFSIIVTKLFSWIILWYMDLLLIDDDSPASILHFSWQFHSCSCCFNLINIHCNSRDILYNFIRFFFDLGLFFCIVCLNIFSPIVIWFFVNRRKIRSAFFESRNSGLWYWAKCNGAYCNDYELNSLSFKQTHREHIM